MKKVLIFGDGAVATDAFFDLEHDSPYEVVAFTKDGDYIKDTRYLDKPMVPFEEVTELYSPSEHFILVALGYADMNGFRANRFAAAQTAGYELMNCISSTAYTWGRWRTGPGNNLQVGPNTVIHPTVQIGEDVIIGPGTLISPNCVIKDHAFIGAGVAISENVTVESRCYLAANSNIRNGVTIGQECVIGAGALILDDTQPKEVYMAEPSEKLPITSDKIHLS